MTSAVVSDFNDHLAWSTDCNLDGWAWSLDALEFTWTAALGSLKKRECSLDLALCALWFWYLWTVGLLLSAALARKNLVSWATLGLISVQVFTLWYLRCFITRISKILAKCNIVADLITAHLLAQWILRVGPL